MTELKRRSEVDALRYVLQQIAEFPLVGHAALAMQLMAKGALAIDADAHAQRAPKTIGRQWIIDLIRDQFDPAPSHFKLGDNWDDGAETIAESILANLPLLRAENSAVTSTECGDGK